MIQQNLPPEGFLRINQIVGDKARGIAPIVPVARSTWWAGIKAGYFPAPVKLGPKTTVWRASDIRKLIEGAE